jgi:high-affinity nickel-transport protein
MTIALVSIILVGFFLGVRHAADPDHVTAVAAIVSREPRFGASARVGLIWGLGHSLTIFLVGSAIILFKIVIPPRLELSMEFAVAVMLIVLGLSNLTGLVSWLREWVMPTGRRVHSHPHTHEGIIHTHVHVHATEPHEVKSVHAVAASSKPGSVLRSFVTGVVHGLAGSAAIALLVLGAIQETAWAIAYLVVFGFGTIIGMVLITSLLAAPVVLGSKRFELVNRYLPVTSGALSLIFGLVLAYEIGWIQGLFRG